MKCFLPGGSAAGFGKTAAQYYIPEQYGPRLRIGAGIPVNYKADSSVALRPSFWGRTGSGSPPKGVRNPWIKATAGDGTEIKKRLEAELFEGDSFDGVNLLRDGVLSHRDLDLPLTPGAAYTIEAGDENGLLETAEVAVIPDPAVYGRRVYPYTHTKEGTVHRLAGQPDADRIAFTASAPYLDGDTWTVNGARISVTYRDGQALLPTAVIAGDALEAVFEGDTLRLQLDRPAPRKNILINALFDQAHLVNQRGQAQYTGAGYGIDFWKGETPPTRLAVENDCIKLYTEAAWATLSQPIDPQMYAGSVVTICFDIKESAGTDSAGAFTIDMRGTDSANEEHTYLLAHLPPGTAGMVVCTSNVIPRGMKSLRARIISRPSQTGENYVRIRRGRLEEGPRFTGRDNPKPGETLAECQRCRFAPWRTGGTQGYTGFVQASSPGSTCYGMIYTPVTLRTKPVIAQGPKDLLYWGTVKGAHTTNATVTAAAVFGYTNNGVHMKYTLDATLAAGDHGMIYTNSPGPDTLLFDCNL